MNKYHRNRHLAIRNIQRTDWFGQMSYREARRKYKAGYRAIPVGSGYFTRWFLFNFGSEGLTLAQTRKLGKEYALISEHAESYLYKAVMNYDIRMHCLIFQYRGSIRVWRFRISFEQAVPLIDSGRLAEFVMRSAEIDIPNLARYDFVKVTGTSILAYASTGISDNNVDELARIRDRMRGVSSLHQTCGSRLLPIFAGYGITKVDK